MTHVDLSEAFRRQGLTEVQGMNLLQANGIISDNCVQVADVAEANCQRAIEFIGGQWLLWNKDSFRVFNT